MLLTERCQRLREKFVCIFGQKMRVPILSRFPGPRASQNETCSPLVKHLRYARMDKTFVDSSIETDANV